MNYIDKKLKSLLQGSARGSLILMISQLSSTVIMAAGMLIAARVLGSTKWGVLNIANSVVSFAATFQNIKIRPGLVKYISSLRHEEKEGDVRAFINVGVLMTLICSLIVFMIVFIFSDYISVRYYGNPELGFYIRVLSISLFARNMLTTVYGIVIGFEQMKYYGVLQIIYSVLKSFLTPLLIFWGFGVLGGILGELGPVLITGSVGVFVLYILGKSVKGDKTYSNWTIFVKLLKYGVPLYVSSLFLGIRPNLFTGLLGIHVSEEVVGNWSVVLWFSSLISFVNQPISNAIFPLFSKLDNNKDLEFVYKLGVKYSTLFIFPIIFTIMSLSDHIFEVLFPSDYVFGPTFLRYYMITFLYVGLGSTCNGSLLNGRGLTDRVFWGNLVQFVITVPLSFLAIPRFGVLGIICLLLIGTLFSQIFNLYSIKINLGFSFNWINSVKLLLSGAFAYLTSSLVVNLITIHPIVEVFFGGIVSVLAYFLGIVFFKVLNKADIRYMKDLSSSIEPMSKVVLFLLVILEKYI